MTAEGCPKLVLQLPFRPQGVLRVAENEQLTRGPFSP